MSGSMTTRAGWPGAPSPELRGVLGVQGTLVSVGRLLSVGRSVPSELAQPVVVDSEVVCDLMYYRDSNFVQYLLAGRAHPKRRPAEDRDPIRQCSGGPASIPLGQWRPVIDAEQVRIIRRWFILDKEHHVVHEVEQFSRDGVERVPDGLVKLLRRQLQHSCHPVTVWSLPHIDAGLLLRNHRIGVEGVASRWFRRSKRQAGEG